MLTPLIGAKLVIAAVAGSIALGGAAAATGLSLNGPGDAYAIAAPAVSTDDPSATATESESEAATASASATATDTATASPSASPTKTPKPHQGTDVRFLFGLCRAYTAQSGTPLTASDQSSSDGVRKALTQSEVLAKLQAIATAKGVTVDQLCTAVLAAKSQQHDPTTCDHRQGADDPSGGPSTAPSGRKHGSGSQGGGGQFGDHSGHGVGHGSHR